LLARNHVERFHGDTLKDKRNKIDIINTVEIHFKNRNEEEEFPTGMELLARSTISWKVNWLEWCAANAPQCGRNCIRS
jgi:hypothetical protein